MGIETGLSSNFLLVLNIITPQYKVSGFLVLLDHYCIMEKNFKKGKSKNKIRTLYPKNYE